MQPNAANIKFSAWASRQDFLVRVCLSLTEHKRTPGVDKNVHMGAYAEARGLSGIEGGFQKPDFEKDSKVGVCV